MSKKVIGRTGPSQKVWPGLLTSGDQVLRLRTTNRIVSPVRGQGLKPRVKRSAIRGNHHILHSPREGRRQTPIGDRKFHPSPDHQAQLFRNRSLAVSHRTCLCLKPYNLFGQKQNQRLRLEHGQHEGIDLFTVPEQ